MTAPAPGLLALLHAGAVLGVDPGLRVTGWALLDADGVHCRTAWGVFRSRPGRPRPDRLQAITAAVQALIAEHRPVALAVERPFLKANVRSAMTLSQAQAAVFIAAAAQGVPVIEYAPRVVKHAVTGDGDAAKAVVARLLRVQLGLDADPSPPDAADALGVAFCHHLAAGRLALAAPAR